MAKVKALVSFAGAISMGKDEVREIDNKTILDDLLNAGYVEAVEATAKPKTQRKRKKVMADEDQ